MATQSEKLGNASALARKVLDLPVEQQLEVLMMIAPSILAHVDERDRGRLLHALAPTGGPGQPALQDGHLGMMEVPVDEH